MCLRRAWQSNCFKSVFIDLIQGIIDRRPYLQPCFPKHYLENIVELMLNAAILCVLKHFYSINLPMRLVMHWANVLFLCACVGFRSFRAVGSLGQLQPETNAHPERETARKPSGPTALRRNPPPHREQTWTDWWDASSNQTRPLGKSARHWIKIIMTVWSSKASMWGVKHFKALYEYNLLWNKRIKQKIVKIF